MFFYSQFESTLNPGIPMKISHTMFSKSEIRQIVQCLGYQLNEHYQNVTEEVIVIGLLKGSVIFLADLVRELSFDIHLEFMSVSSYGAGTVSSKDVRIQQDLDVSITGRHVLLVEDIVDSGYTFAKVLKMLGAREPKSLKTVSLLSKPSRRQVEVAIDFVGVEIPDEFVCGYGMDYAQKYRNLPDLVVLAPN